MRSAPRSAVLFHPWPRRKSNMLAVKHIVLPQAAQLLRSMCAFSHRRCNVCLSWRLVCDGRSAAAADTSSLLWKSRMQRPHRAYLLINGPAASCSVVFNLTRVSFYPTWQSDKWHFASCVFFVTGVEECGGWPPERLAGEPRPHLTWQGGFVTSPGNETCLNTVVNVRAARSGAARNRFNVFCIDGAVQRAHPGRHAAGEEDHSDGHCGPGARQVR